jgi:hypothetical protein
MEEGGHLYGINPSISYIRAIRDETIEPEITNLRVATQPVGTHTTGCVPEHESFGNETRTVVADCPDEEARRCGNCIMRIAGGDEVVRSLKPMNL